MANVFLIVGIILAVEGCLYAAFPAAMKRMMALMGQQPDDTLRVSGLAAASFGVGIVWLVKSFL